ncbi:hypothetical protein [Adhaeribacter terreus]|uniref:Beta-propeller repeat-containing protein n=1 Tax=Adhaeribacter terreus TaxID=529703 RepID=A0ABW0ECZ8_9BACT
MKKLLLLCFFIGLTSLTAFAQYFQWAKMQDNSAPFSTPGNYNYSYPQGGNYLANTNNLLATTGLFYDDITLGNQTFILSDSIDAYLALYDLNGNVLWAKQIISQTPIRPSVAIDNNHNIVISGVFRDSLYIDGQIFKASAANKMGVYAVKFSPTGSFLWAQSSDVNTGNYQTEFFEPSVKTDTSGNVYIAGNFINTFTFNNTSLHTTYNSKIYLVKINESGVSQWVTSVGDSTRSNHTININVTDAGNIYLAYTLMTPPAPFWGNKITKLNTAGNVLWTSTVIGPGATGVDLVTDKAENVYLTGYFFQNIMVGNTTLNTNTGSCLLAKVNASGNLVWAKSIATWLTPGSGFIFGTPKITISADQNIAVTGQFSGIPQFSGSTLTIPSSSEGTFISQLDTAGYTVWVNTVMDATQPSFVYPTALTGDQAGNFYLQGTFGGSFQFGSTTLNASPLAGNFLTKINFGGSNAVQGKIFVDSNANGIYDVAETPFRQLVLNTSLGNVNSYVGSGW